MITILTILIVGTLNIACFFIGAKVGQTVAKGEMLKAPNLNPIEAARDYQDKKRERKELDRYEVIMGNIEAYDGTSYGQKEVPKG